MKKILFILLIFPFCVSAQLKINEIMSNNVSSKMDEQYNYSMWVELYNAGTVNVNWNTCYFTDNVNTPKKWRPLTSKSIAPGNFAILWFERSDIYNHSNFKLEPEGGKLYMFNAAGEVLDSVRYPAQRRNISYGRKTDGGEEWTFFEVSTPATSNNNGTYATSRCKSPAFSLEGGFYPTAKRLKFDTPATGDSIYYTTNGAEPTRTNAKYYTPGQDILITTTAIIRAKAFSAGKLSSDIVSRTFFINYRKITLPVVSIITEQKNLTDNTIGIYVQGTNGITGNGMNTPANWNRDWDRPANYELFDVDGKTCLNQELDIAIAGAWSRTHSLKSLKIQPRKKYGDNKLRYDDLFPIKQGKKFKSILLRNSGNDNGGSQMRDAFMQSLLIGRMDVDYQAYQPAVCFINGVYYGILNLRERSNKDNVYTNHGFDEDEIFFVTQETSSQEYNAFSSYLRNNNVVNQTVYQQVEKMVDIDSYIDYVMAQVYFDNTDWPQNNYKMWKAKENGKWRWILYDTDFGFSNYNSNTWNHFIQNGDERISYPFKRLLLNTMFKNKFIDRFCIHISSTFETNRVNAIMDSLSSKIRTEIAYHKVRWGGSALDGELNNYKNFAKNRPDRMMSFLSTYFFQSVPIQTINISSNEELSSYKFNDETIIDNHIALKYFRNKTVRIEAPGEVAGHKFQHWELTPSPRDSTLIPMGTNWRYWDSNKIPSAQWFIASYNDAEWKTGNAPLGYGGSFAPKTVISYGGNSDNKNITAYFRKTVTIENLASKDNFSVNLYVDDGAVVYVNGRVIGRYNMPDGNVAYSTLASSAINGDMVTLPVSKSYLKEGENVFAVEVHQCNSTSSDLIFDFGLSYQIPPATNEKLIVEAPVYTTTLNSNLTLKAIYDIGTGINELPKESKSADIRLYPTLVVDYLTVENAFRQNIKIFDITGKKVYETIAASETEKISLGILPKGVYILSTGNKSFKIIKQ